MQIKYINIHHNSKGGEENLRDRNILKGSGLMEMTVAYKEKANGQAHDQWLEFNLHDIVGMRVAAEAPTAPIFKDMFAPFITDQLDTVNLTITGELEDLEEGAFGEVHGETEFHYNERGLHLHSYDVQIFRDDNGFRLNGKLELLVMALPIIDRLMVVNEAAMVHALTVDYRGHGICIPAWGGTGKTSTMAKLVKTAGFSFMGDDWAFMSRAGELLGYAKPMFIKPYHRPIYPHLFEKTHKPLVPIKLSKSVAHMTTLMHPYVTRYPQFASLTRRWSPEHMMVTPERAFPEGRFSTRAPLAAALFVERYETGSSAPIFKEKDTEWMVSKLIGNFNSELPKQSRVVMTALGASGLEPIEQFFCEKAAVLREALCDKPAFLLRVPQAMSPDQASDVIVEHVEKIISIAGIR